MNIFSSELKISTSTSQAFNLASRKLSFEDDIPFGCTTETSTSSLTSLFLRSSKKHQSESAIPELGLNKKVSEGLMSANSSPFRETQLRTYISCCSTMKKQASTQQLMAKIGSRDTIPSSTDISETQESATSKDASELASLFGMLSLAKCNVIDGKARGSFSEPCELMKLSHPKRSFEPMDLTRGYNKSLSLTLNKNNRDPDLNTISHQTVAKILHENQAHEYLIIDCRYPYEFQGGHIQGAINVLSPDVLETIFFANQDLLSNQKYLADLKKDPQATLANVETYRNQEDQEGSRPLFIIFHCEFSQKRGPRAFRELRKRDRNMNVWPKLDFPEIYVLEGGYCNFYEQFPELCDGDYVDMTHKEYKTEYAKAKEMDKQLWSKKDVIGFSPGI